MVTAYLALNRSKSFSDLNSLTVVQTSLTNQEGTVQVSLYLTRFDLLDDTHITPGCVSSTGLFGKPPGANPDLFGKPYGVPPDLFGKPYGVEPDLFGKVKS